MGAGPGPGILRNTVRLPGDGEQCSVGPHSGAFPLSGSSPSGAAAGLPGFRDAPRDDALSNASIPASIRTRGSGVQRREAGAGASGRLPRSPGALPGVPRGDSGRPAVHTCLFLRARHVPFALLPRTSGRSRADGSRSGAGASACGSFPRVVVFCRIVFPGRRCTLTAIPVPFRREEKFRCQISPPSLFLPLWTGCLTRRCARC